MWSGTSMLTSDTEGAPQEHTGGVEVGTSHVEVSG